jgi:hypothetical protein
MNKNQYVFAQLIEQISPKSFQTIVRRYNGDYKVQNFSCWKQFLCMAFGQLTHRESISDTLLCLQANEHKLYHLGIGKTVSKSTLTRANEHRSYRIYQDLSMLLIAQAKQLYAGENKLDVKLPNQIFAIDATTIDLCLASFAWALFRSSKSGVKLHTVLDIKTTIPDFIYFSNAKISDVNALDVISFLPDSIYIMDRGYVDCKRLYKIHCCGAFFIVRAKKNMDVRRIYSRGVDKKSGVVCDQIVVLNNFYPSKLYPQKIRRIKFRDNETGKVFVFLTNNFHIKAADIAQLYKHRWEIELFFKWIKQHLKITAFWGHSENAVKTQIWIAVAVYVLVAIAKKKFCIQKSLYEILQIFSLNLLDKTPINQLFLQPQLQYFKEPEYNQLNIFDL